MEQQNNKTDCRDNCDFYDWSVGTCGGECATLHEVEKTLKRCPFCKSKAEIVTNKFWIGSCKVKYAVCCSNYECFIVPSTRYDEDLDEVVRRWNTREE